MPDKVMKWKTKIEQQTEEKEKDHQPRLVPRDLLYPKKENKLNLQNTAVEDFYIHIYIFGCEKITLFRCVYSALLSSSLLRRGLVQCCVKFLLLASTGTSG